MKTISTCLWFDTQAEEAARLYIDVFGGKVEAKTHYPESSARVANKAVGSVMTVEFEMANLKVTGLNGGPLFKFSPSFSFFVGCDSEQDIRDKWNRLSAGGTVRMNLDRYPWAEMYGWTSDAFGVEWQLILAPRPETIAPAFLFTDSLFGKGQEAVDFYTSLFPNSKIDSIAKDESTGTVMHASFTLNGQSFALMEGQGKHGHSFNESMSLIVNCESQEEIDSYWDRLISGGGKPSQCGWLKDRFGVSWQIVPADRMEYAKDPVKFKKAADAIMKMVKLDMAEIERAAKS